MGLLAHLRRHADRWPEVVADILHGTLKFVAPARAFIIACMATAATTIRQFGLRMAVTVFIVAVAFIMYVTHTSGQAFTSGQWFMLAAGAIVYSTICTLSVSVAASVFSLWRNLRRARRKSSLLVSAGRLKQLTKAYNWRQGFAFRWSKFISRMRHGRPPAGPEILRLTTATLDLSSWLGNPSGEPAQAILADAYQPVHLAGIPYPRGVEFLHTLVVGGTSAERTNLLSEVLSQIVARGERAVIIGADDRLVGAHFRPASDDVINPWDEGGMGWSPVADCPDRDAWIAFVRHLHWPGNVVWSDEERRAAAIMAMGIIAIADKRHERNERVTLKDLLRLFNIDHYRIEAALQGTSVASYWGQEESNQTIEVRRRILALLEPVATFQGLAETFSIRDWIDREVAARCLYIAAPDIRSAQFDPIRQVMAAIVLNAALHRRDTTQPLWLIIENADTLDALADFGPTLAEALSRNHVAIIASGAYHATDKLARQTSAFGSHLVLSGLTPEQGEAVRYDLGVRFSAAVDDQAIPVARKLVATDFLTKLREGHGLLNFGNKAVLATAKVRISVAPAAPMYVGQARTPPPMPPATNHKPVIKRLPHPPVSRPIQPTVGDPATKVNPSAPVGSQAAQSKEPSQAKPATSNVAGPSATAPPAAPTPIIVPHAPAVAPVQPDPPKPPPPPAATLDVPETSPAPKPTVSKPSASIAWINRFKPK